MLSGPGFKSCENAHSRTDLKKFATTHSINVQGIQAPSDSRKDVLIFTIPFWTLILNNFFAPSE